MKRFLALTKAMFLIHVRERTTLFWNIGFPLFLLIIYAAIWGGNDVAGADLVLFPSLHEGFGLPVVEGMASGVPVAASSVCSIPEVGGDSILTFDPVKIDEIVSAAERALFDPEMRTILVERGLARAARFTWAEAARKTSQIYRDLLAR